MIIDTTGYPSSNSMDSSRRQVIYHTKDYSPSFYRQAENQKPILI
jgi:hypothetical protein